jgi:hypothetical protein
MGRTIDIAVLQGQTLEDLALQHYGAVEGVDYLLQVNRAVLTGGLNTELTTGMILKIDTSLVLNRKLKKALAINNVIPANRG